MKENKIVLFGGNGFVGTAIAEELVASNAQVVCVSRTGVMPAQLKNQAWAEQVEWHQGDALHPEHAVFDDAQAVVALVGSPPIPTFSKRAFENQLMMNSEPNLAVIKALTDSNTRRLVLLSAHIPKVMQTDKFAYAKGKRLCEEAAEQFANRSADHTAIVLKPSGIYGVRYTKAGKPINLAVIMRPIAALQGGLPDSISQFLPESLVSIKAVAKVAARSCLDDQKGVYKIINNNDIILSVK